MIIYLHGFNSSPLSSKAVLLAEYCAARGVPFVAPQLHHRPSRAAAQITKLCDDQDADMDVHTLVGSSMGGYYATWFCETRKDVRAVLINPAVGLADKLAEFEGQEQTNYHNDDCYLFTPEHTKEFRALAVEKIADPQKYFLLAQKGDEVLDYREAESFYAGGRLCIEEGGDHSFVEFERHLREIVRFAGYQVED